MKYYQRHKNLILTVCFAFLYFSPIERIISKKWILFFLKFISAFPIFFLTTFLLSELKVIIFEDFELVKVSFTFLLLSFTTYSILTIFSFYYHQSEFIRLFEMWDDLLQTDFYSEERKELLLKTKKEMDKIIRIFLILVSMPGLAYSAFTYAQTEKKLNYPSGIPYRHQSPDFELVATLDLGVTVTGFLVGFGYDCIILEFLSLVYVQILHLKKILGNILGVVSINSYGELVIKNKLGKFGYIPLNSLKSTEVSETFLETQKKVRIWIIYHQRVIELFVNLQKIFGVNLSFKFISLTITLCVSCFLASMKGKTGLINLFVMFGYCLNTSLLLYINIKLADSINETNYSIFEEAFFNNWDLYPKKLKNLLLMIIMRSDRLLQLKVLGKYPFNSASFLKVLSMAYSLLTLLLHLNRSNEEAIKNQLLKDKN